MIFVESNDRLVIEKYLIFTSSKRTLDTKINDNQANLSKRSKVREKSDDEVNDTVRFKESKRFIEN